MISETQAAAIAAAYERYQPYLRDRESWNSFYLELFAAGFSYQQWKDFEGGRVEPDVQLYCWDDLPMMATGIYLMGDPGSGKTTTVRALLGLITQRIGAAQITIIDPHNQPGKWPDRVEVIEDASKSVEWMRWMTYDRDHPDTLGKRKADLKVGIQHPPFIWVVDEIGDIALECEMAAEELRLQAKRCRAIGGEDNRLAAADLEYDAAKTQGLIGKFLIALGAQGRKYNYLGICGNQSGNVKSQGMDGKGDYLESFIKIYVGRLVDKWAKIYGLNQACRDYLAAQAYPCLVNQQPADHLTHWQYTKRERGQPPLWMPEPLVLDPPAPAIALPQSMSTPHPSQQQPAGSDGDRQKALKIRALRDEGVSWIKIMREFGYTGPDGGSAWTREKNKLEEVMKAYELTS